MAENKRNEFGEIIPGMAYRDRSGVYAVIEADGKIAVINTKDRIFLPGGGLEGEESHHACLIRECSEELGCDVEIAYYIGCASQYLLSFKDGEPLRIIGHVYLVRITGTNNLKIEDDHDLSWLSPDEAIASMYVEFQAWAIEEYMRTCSLKKRA
ncbi:MAG: mismatch repair protein MutT [Paenibacillaceae bacterium]|nr:mismatch repair protein MutT [Paenibacillaceae bacterium]